MTTKTNITYLNCNINEIKLENKDIPNYISKKKNDISIEELFNKNVINKVLNNKQFNILNKSLINCPNGDYLIFKYKSNSDNISKNNIESKNTNNYKTLNFYKGSIKEEIISLQNNENMIIFSIDTNTYVTKKIQKSYFKYTKYKNTNNIDENNTKKPVSKSKETKKPVSKSKETKKPVSKSKETKKPVSTNKKLVSTTKKLVSTTKKSKSTKSNSSKSNNILKTNNIKIELYGEEDDDEEIDLDDLQKNLSTTNISSSTKIKSSKNKTNNNKKDRKKYKKIINNDDDDDEDEDDDEDDDDDDIVFEEEDGDENEDGDYKSDEDDEEDEDEDEDDDDEDEDEDDNLNNNKQEDDNNINDNSKIDNTNQPVEKGKKKRGRKPKIRNPEDINKDNNEKKPIKAGRGRKKSKINPVFQLKDLLEVKEWKPELLKSKLENKFRHIIFKILMDKKKFSEEICRRIELSIYNFTIEKCNTLFVFSHWDNKEFTHFYINKAKSIISNLCSDYGVKNVDINKIMKNKKFNIDRVAYMSYNELYPKNWQLILDEKIKNEQLIKDSSVLNVTDMFTCGKCKKNKCSYFELQTRSADEPMTTFVTCLECGNKWKF